MKDHSGKRVPQAGRLAFGSSLAVIPCLVPSLSLNSSRKGEERIRVKG